MQNQNGVCLEKNVTNFKSSDNCLTTPFVKRDSSADGFSTLNLTSQQLQKITLLRQLTDQWNDLQPKERAFLNDMCLFRFILKFFFFFDIVRFLKGWNWDVKEASKNLKEAVEWRKKFNPESLSLNDPDIKEVAQSGFMFHFGFDRSNRPVVYLFMEKDNKATKEGWEQKVSLSSILIIFKFKYAVYVLEQCIQKMDESRGIYQITFVVDLKGLKVTLDLVKKVQAMFIKLGDYYSERLNVMLIIGLPMWANPIWQCIKVFLAKETVAKIQFIKKNKKLETLLKYIDEENLLAYFGGKAQYDHLKQLNGGVKN